MRAFYQKVRALCASLRAFDTLFPRVLRVLDENRLPILPSLPQNLILSPKTTRPLKKKFQISPTFSKFQPILKHLFLPQRVNLLAPEPVAFCIGRGVLLLGIWPLLVRLLRRYLGCGRCGLLLLSRLMFHKSPRGFLQYLRL